MSTQSLDAPPDAQTQSSQIIGKVVRRNGAHLAQGGKQRRSFQRIAVLIALLLPAVVAPCTAEDLGNFSANPYAPDSTANPFGAGSPFAPHGINNPFSPQGNPFSNRSATNPFATDAPRLYDRQGHYRGKLSANQFDLDSISNPFGRYGSPFSPDSLNNPFGAGNPFRTDSPNNPYGSGWRIEGAE